MSPSVDGNGNLIIQLHIHSRPKMYFFYISEYDVAAPFSLSRSDAENVMGDVGLRS